MSDHQTERDAALAFVNEVRALSGKRPVKRLKKGGPRGYPGPLERTIGGTKLSPKTASIKIPPLVMEFLRLFYEGAYPDLVLPDDKVVGYILPRLGSL